MISTLTYDYNIDDYASLVKANESFTLVGIPIAGKLTINIFQMVRNRINLNGSLICGIPETQETVNYCAENEIVPTLELVNAGQITLSGKRLSTTKHDTAMSLMQKRSDRMGLNLQKFEVGRVYWKEVDERINLHIKKIRKAMALIDNLKWRYATKAYDETKKVSQANINMIVEAARLAPTSSGLQPFKVFVVENQDLKNQLAQGALNPECMRECSHALVFAAWDNYTAERIDEIYDLTTDERQLPRGSFDSYTSKIKSEFQQRHQTDNFAHAARQAYIALAMSLAQAAELKVDSTPAEGFDHNVVDSVLNLSRYGLKRVLIMYVGYADPQRDWLRGMKKVRHPKEQFVLEFR